MAEDPDDLAEGLHRAELELAEARENEEPVRLSSALIERARCLHRLRRTSEALDALGEVIGLSADSDDVHVRERIASAMWLRMQWSRRDVGVPDTLAAARELFTLCNAEPSAVLERYAARALGIQADAQRRLGDSRAAIATRRWLLSEFRDTRPQGRPDLIFDEWCSLTLDLANDGQLAEAAAESRRLILALEDAEVSAPQARIADAMKVRVLTLRDGGSPAESRAVDAELQMRFRAAAEPDARLIAATTCVDLIRRLLAEGDVASAVSLTSTVIERFESEGDERIATSLAGRLQDVARWMAEGAEPRLLPLTWLVARTHRLRTMPRSRPRLRAVDATRARLDCAMRVTDLLQEHFGRDASSGHREIAVQASLRRAMILAKQGRWRACGALLGQFTDSAPTTLAALIGEAHPVGPARYSMTVWMAAFMGSTVDLGSGPEADRTRAAIREILHAHRNNPAADWFARNAAHEMDKKARRSR